MQFTQSFFTFYPYYISSCTSDRGLTIPEINASDTSILTNESTEITCVVEGKPIIKKEDITWYRENTSVENSSVDLSGNFTTEKGTHDYMLISILTLNSPNKSYNGNFTCTANETEKKSIKIEIAGI